MLKKRWAFSFLLNKTGQKFGRKLVEETMNEENEWDQVVESDVVEGPMEKVTRKKIVKVMQKIRLEKATVPSEASVEMMIANGKIGVQVMVNLCQCILNGRGIPDEWKTSVNIPNFKGKGDLMCCGS